MPAPTAETLIDRVDESDRPQGVVRRGEVFEEGANFRVVHVLLFDADDALLVQQLGAKRDRHPLRWGSSVAGYLHAGESYEDGANRRTREELGLRPELWHVGRTWMEDEGSKKFIGVYTGVVGQDEPSIREPYHIEAIKFVHPEELHDRLSRAPEEFTDTFRHVLQFSRAQQAP